ncbi:MAG TPA: VIT1/CCC1 transporter family protein [Pseudomonadales bacterium]|nr:VIT1/CCC1 transporter family protein [Pseudomonadales bacterium]
MTSSTPPDPRLARRLILDELFDLSLYEALQPVAPPPERKVLAELIPVERRHLEFWQRFFALRLDRLDWGRRLKLAFLVLVCRVLGAPAIRLVLEAIEVHGVRKYLGVWKTYGDGPLGPAVREVLEDEFRHEDVVVTGGESRWINAERVRDIFLGGNDGLVEILGAMSGFFAAFGASVTLVMAGLTVAVAGALSMAAGAYIAVSSEIEVARVELERRRFLGEAEGKVPVERPVVTGLVVGISYFLGALVPVLPFLFGATTVVPTILTAGSIIIAVSTVLSFLSGMDVGRRLLTNLVIIAAAVSVTYAIGVITRSVWGISV